MGGGGGGVVWCLLLRTVLQTRSNGKVKVSTIALPPAIELGWEIQPASEVSLVPGHHHAGYIMVADAAARARVGEYQ